MLNKNGLLMRVLVAAVAALIVIVLYPRKSQTQYYFKEGDVWNYADLRAEVPVVINPDSAVVKQVRDSVINAVVPLYDFTPVTARSLIHYPEELSAVFRAVKYKLDAQLNQTYKAQRASDGLYHWMVDDATADRIAAGLEEIDVVINGKTVTVKTDGLVGKSDFIQRITDYADSLGVGDELKALKLDAVIVPNAVYNAQRTDDLIAKGMDASTRLRPDTIKVGQTIITRGAKVNHNDYAKLQAYQDALDARANEDTRASFLIIMGQILYVLLVIGSLFVYLAVFEQRVFANLRWFIFIMLLEVVFFVMAAAINPLFGYNGVYLVPICIVPILVLVFFDARTAMFCLLNVVLLCAGITSYPLEFFFIELIAGGTAIYSLGQLSKRSQLLRTALISGAGAIVAYVALELMFNGSFSAISWRMLALLVVSAILTSFAYILVFVCEKMFDFISVVTLVELTDINNPVLRELSDKCPGTFQHSMAVSNLASDAAVKIGADATLIRAGALYHDIGKISNPAFFTENQGGVSPHNSLPAQTSAEIIISHVYEGLRRADKAKLPTVIKDFIRQHHGAGKAKYFYFTHCKEHPGEEIDPAPFTYPGPNPQTIEASILMMADAVEAASRSLTEYTPESISQLVNKIIDGQIAEGLHNESPLSFRDVSRIKDTFIKRLKTLYHSRIVYPEDPNKKS